MTRQHNVGQGGPLAYWAAMRALTERDGSFTTRDVAERCRTPGLNTVRCYVRSCARAGHLEEVGRREPMCPQSRPQKLYAVKVTAPHMAPFEKPDRVALLGATQRQLWTAMRALQSFTSRDLAAVASTDEISINPVTARVYCWKLEQAGYLQCLGKRSRWRVLRIMPGKNLGPYPPVITGSGDVIDRNPRARRRAS